MCGIFGEFITKSKGLTEKHSFLSLLKLSRSRGPDKQGYFTNSKNLQFGFNRLSIQDLSDNGNQPIHSPSGKYIMVFNGEIYNHLDIRKSLPVDKYHFNGNGDTESLITFFDYFGIVKTVERIEGMFAIGIFDLQEDCLFLIRDIAGIKPLHYGYKNKNVVFSSQFNQLSKHPIFHNEQIDKNVLKLYLNQHFVPPPYGLLNNTYSVNPGEIISFDKNGIKPTITYWTFPEYDSEINKNQNVINKIERNLQSVVHSELISDVPVGSFLSGGVDSPLISYFAKKNNQNDFNTFSMGSDSLTHDETEQAHQYANALGTNHYSIKMTAENSLNALESSVETAGEPIGDFSIIPTWELSRLAKEHVKVILSGDGGDELFFGYERFRSIGKNYSIWKYPYWIRKFIWGFEKLIFNEKHFNECVLVTSPGEAHRGLHCRFPNQLIQSIAPDLSPCIAPPNYNTYNYAITGSENHLLHKIRKAEFYGMLQKTLTKIDRASMAHGLEIRVPFLNKKFLEMIFRINVSDHQPLVNRKKLLYQLLQKSYPKILPGKIKKGFSIPLSSWIRTSYHKPFKEKLLDQSFYQSFGFNKTAIEDLFSQHISQKWDYKWPLFTLYSLAIWNKQGRKLE